ncbi:carboxymuconolactone decarboxylase family protein [Tomitella fengzijianii]|uniref:Carboxymuconolactone decarboxylase family protein n=1 Tax=Tomitella fengzijianii TaxID=2597660 RepID=A0A516X5E8_9ACTN|nr:carboxymuconolactone decarboxylase family protein [Tomitella fengzijianii]QDQ98286.1 carboxymuconolactone decarboxylase family protein [Tomitella fengzijianii]
MPAQSTRKDLSTADAPHRPHVVPEPPRIDPGGFRELGIVNWAFCRTASLVTGVPDAHIFSTLGRARGLFRGWLHFSAMMMPFGRIRRRETELVILRVAHLRGCDYEVDHHRRLGARAGIDDAMLQRIFEGPDAEGWHPNERALLLAVDQLVQQRDIDDDTWATVSSYFDKRQLIELVMLVGQYDSLATTLGVLRVQRDFAG